VKEAVDFGYLEHRQFGRIGRVRGEKYGELVRLMKNSQLSLGLEILLDSMCSISGCRHS
jgi:hypothetical protein